MPTDVRQTQTRPHAIVQRDRLDDLQRELDRAVDAGRRRRPSAPRFIAQGQKCSACSRVYVESTVKDRFLGHLVDRVRALRLARFLDHVQAGVTDVDRRSGATTRAWPGVSPFAGWKASGSTGRGSGGPYCVQPFVREQSRVIVR